MRNLDPGAGDSQADEQRDQEALRVREPASLHHCRVRPRPDWPFLFYEHEGVTYLNRAPRRKRDLDSYGEAPW